jgi:TPR repeat protein
MDGSGVKKDQQLGIQWLRKAADHGDARAQRALGQVYRFGYGVDEDKREAARWYRMAADQGDAEALNNLGDLHEHGAGGQRQDYAEAARLYEAAARQGLPYGQRNLARMYREGLGVPSDAVVAYGWINLAASANSPHPNAADERDTMAQYMPKNLIAEGQRLAREWKPGTSLGKSKLKPVDVAPLAAAWAMKVGMAVDSKPADQPIGQYPARPEAKPGLTTCNTRCVNGDCYRTYGDGRKVHFQAHQKWNPFNNQFEWDSGSC